MDSIPADLLELQTRFETWRATRKHIRESMPDELRSATLEMRQRYPPSLIQRVLKVDPARLKKTLPAIRSAPTATAPEKKPQPSRPAPPGGPKQKSKSSPQTQAAPLSQSAFFKLPTTDKFSMVRFPVAHGESSAIALDASPDAGSVTPSAQQ